MRIKFDNDLYLNSDEHCYWMSQKRIAKDTKREREEVVSGYCPTLEKCIASYCERQVRGCDVTSLTAFRKEMKKLKKDLEKIICTVSEKKE